MVKDICMCFHFDARSVFHTRGNMQENYYEKDEKRVYRFSTVTVVFSGAIDELGDMPYYAEHCASMLAVTYSSGQGMQRNIVSGF